MPNNFPLTFPNGGPPSPSNPSIGLPQIIRRVLEQDISTTRHTLIAITHPTTLSNLHVEGPPQLFHEGLVVHELLQLSRRRLRFKIKTTSTKF